MIYQLAALLGAVVTVVALIARVQGKRIEDEQRRRSDMEMRVKEELKKKVSQDVYESDTRHFTDQLREVKDKLEGVVKSTNVIGQIANDISWLKKEYQKRNGGGK